MIRQTAVFVENRKGMIRKIMTAMKENGIRVCAFSTVDSPEFGIVRMIADQPHLADAVLTEEGFTVKECDVIAVSLTSTDEIESLLLAVEDGNVNINYFYSAFGREGTDPVLILSSADMDETEELLVSRGFACLNQDSYQKEDLN